MSRMTSGARMFGARVNADHTPRRPRGGAESADPQRRSLIGKVHVAKKDLQLTDDDYRAILFDVAQRRSAADCTAAELVAVIERFKSRGWVPAQPKGRGQPKPADHPAAAKARALWISLHHLGAIENPSEQALEIFARRQLGCERLQWANQALTYKLIEALKAIADRHGWSQDMAGVQASAVPLVLRRNLVAAILDKLKAAGLAPADWGVPRAAFEFGGIEMTSELLVTASELDLVARALGDTLRRAGGGAG